MSLYKDKKISEYCKLSTRKNIPGDITWPSTALCFSLIQKYDIHKCGFSTRKFQGTVTWDSPLNLYVMCSRWCFSYVNFAQFPLKVNTISPLHFDKNMILICLILLKFVFLSSNHIGLRILETASAISKEILKISISNLNGFPKAAKKWMTKSGKNVFTQQLLETLWYVN